MDEETRAEFQRLQAENNVLRTDIARLARQQAHTENLVDTHIQLFKQAFSTLQVLMSAEQHQDGMMRRLESRMAKVEDMAIPKLPGEITLSQAIQDLMNTVAHLTQGMVTLKRRMDEPPPANLNDEQNTPQMH